MTNAPEDPPSADEPGDWTAADSAAFLEPDIVLQLLANTASREADFSAPITLTIGGATITGDLVGSVAWLDAHRANGVEAFESLRDEFRASADTNVSERRYFHLKDAFVLAPTGDRLPSNGGMLYRGRLSQVQGWMWGRLGPSTDEPAE